MDIGVVIALPEEFGYFHADIEDDCVAVKDQMIGQYDYIFERPGGLGRHYRCVAAVVGEMGQTKASLLTERLIARWQPRTLVVIGLAGGIGGEVLVGDVVVGTQVDAYLENSKAIPGNGQQEFTFQVAGEVYRPSADLIQASRHFRFAKKPLYGHWKADGATDLADILSESDYRRLMSGQLISKGTGVLRGCGRLRSDCGGGRFVSAPDQGAESNVSRDGDGIGWRIGGHLPAGRPQTFARPPCDLRLRGGTQAPTG